MRPGESVILCKAVSIAINQIYVYSTSLKQSAEEMWIRLTKLDRSPA